MAHESTAAASWRMVYPPPGIGCTTSRESSKDAARFQAHFIGPSVLRLANSSAKLRPASGSYSPECVEGVFYEVRRHGVLRSSQKKNRKLAHLRDAHHFVSEYAAFVAWPTDAA